MDREIAAWSTSFKAQRCDRDATVAELEDHLRSVTYRLTAEGMPEQRAFEVAVSSIGSATDLEAEYDRNSSLLSRIHRAVARFDHLPSGGGANRWPNHAIIGATLVIAAALVLAAVDAVDAAGYLLIAFVPLWLASSGLLGRR